MSPASSWPPVRRPARDLSDSSSRVRRMHEPNCTNAVSLPASIGRVPKGAVATACLATSTMWATSAAATGSAASYRQKSRSA